MRKDNDTPAALPAPMALTAEELRQVAAGTALTLGPTTPVPWLIYGGMLRLPSVAVMTAAVSVQ
jgi:hypothetical protein